MHGIGYTWAGAPSFVSEAVVKAKMAKLVGSTWEVRDQSGKMDGIMVESKPDQALLVSGCTDSVVQAPNGVASVTIDGCSGCGIVFGALKGEVTVTGSKKLQIQCTEMLNTVRITDCDGITVFVSEENKPSIKVYTSKSQQVNVTVLSEEGEEHAIPMQFSTSFKGGKLVTTSADHV